MDITKLSKSKVDSLGQKLGPIFERGRKRGSFTLEEGERIMNISREIGLEENRLNKYYQGLEEEYSKGLDAGYNRGYADGYKTGLEKGMDVTNIPVHQNKN